MPSTPGQYAVIVTEGACSDTSDCYMVLNTTVGQLEQSNIAMEVFPNPSQGQFSVRITGVNHESIQLDIVNIQGKTLLSRNVGSLHNESTTQFNVNLAKGIYFVKMQSGSNVEVKRLLIH
jgi:hypothetical protein